MTDKISVNSATKLSEAINALTACLLYTSDAADE